MLKVLKALTLLMIVLAVLLLLVASPPRILAPMVQPVRMSLLSVAMAVVSKNLNGALTIGSLEGSLLGAPTLREIRLTDLQGDTVFHIEAVNLNYRAADLLRGRIEVDELIARRPWLRFSQDDKGRSNLGQIFAVDLPQEDEATSGGLVFPVSVERLSIRSGTVDLTVPSVPGAREVTNLNLDLRLKLDGNGMQVHVAKGELDASPADVHLETLQGAFAVRDGNLLLDGWQLRTVASDLRLEGGALGGRSPVNFGLILDALDLGEVGRLVGADDLHGVVDGQVRATGPAGSLELVGGFSVGEGEIAFSGTLDVDGAVPRYHGTARVSHLDLADVIAIEAYRGDVNANLVVAGSGRSPDEIAGEFELTVTESRVGDLAIEPSEIRLTADAGLFEVESFLVRASAFTATLEGEVDPAGRSDLAYRVTVDLSSLNDLAEGTALGGQVMLRGRVAGTWPDTFIDGGLESDGLLIEDLALQRLALGFRVDRPFADGARAAAELRGRGLDVGELGFEAVNGEAEYSLDGDRHRARFSVRIDQSPTINASLTGSLSTEGQRTEVVLEEISASLEGRDWLNQGPVRLSYEADRVRLYPMRLQHAAESIDAAGSLFGDKLQGIVLRASAIDLTPLSRLMNLPALANGRVDLEAEIEGTLEAPVHSLQMALRTNSGQGSSCEFAELTLHYAENRLKGLASVEQDGRQVIGAELTLPLDFASTGKAVAERLVDAPISLAIDIDRLSLDALGAVLPDAPALAGMLRGRLDIAGSYASLAADAAFVLEGVALAGVVDGIDGTLAIRGGLETAESFDAVRQAVAATGLGVTLNVLEARSPQIDVQLPGDGAPVRLTLRDLELDADGRWEDGEVSGHVHRFRVSAAGADFPDTELDLAADLDGEMVRVKRLSAATANSEFVGSGEIGLADQRLAFQWDVPSLELTEFVTDFPQSIPSNLGGTIVIGGTLRAPEIDTSLAYAGARLDGEASLELEGDAQRYRAALRVTGLDIAQFRPRLNGRLDLRLDGRGTGFDDRAGHTLNAAIDLRDTEFLPGLTGRLQSELVGGSLQVETLSLRSNGLEMQAEGVLSVAGRSDFDYRLMVKDLSSLKAYLPDDVRAQGNVQGRILGDAGQLHSSNTLNVEDWGYGDLTGGEIDAELQIKDLLESPLVTLKVEIGELAGPGPISGSLRLDGTYAQDKGDFSLTVTEGPFARSLVGGRLNTGDGVEVRLEPLRLRHEKWGWENMQPIRVVVAESGAMILEGVELVCEDQRVSASGMLSPKGTLSADARIDALRLGPIVTAVASNLDGLDGLLNADINIGGVLAEPQLDIALKAADLRAGQQSLGEIKGDINTVGPVVTGRARWLREQEELLSLEGRLDRNASEALDARVLVDDLDLSVFQSLSPEILHSEGRLALDLRLSGSLDRPQVWGALDLRDGGLQLAVLGAVFSDIQGRVFFDGDRATIDGLRIDSETGPAELSGRIETSALALGEIDLRLVANAFSAVDTAAYSAVLSSDLTLKGSGEDLKASGALEVVRAYVRYDRLPTSSGPAAVEPWELTVEGVYGPGPSQVADASGESPAAAMGIALPGLRADVRVAMPGSVWVRGPGTAVEFRGDLRVVKRLEGAFDVTGEVAAVRGFASFFGRRFNVEEGRLDFTGSEVIDPKLNITASHRVSSYNTYVSVTGRSSVPTVSFRSDPELGESDIISLLVFGRTSDQLNVSQQVSLGSSAVNAAGQWAAGELERRIAEGSGLDMVAVELGGETARSSLGVGQYIGPDLFAFYERTFRDPRRSNRSGNTVGIQKRLNERQTLEATGSDLGETAVDWFWRLDY